MKQQRNYIFLDGIMADYMSHYGVEWENKLIEEFKKYLIDLSKVSEIMLVTNQDTSKIHDWLVKNNLLQFFSNISNPNCKQD